MFQSISADEIFDWSKALASDAHPSFWLAQLRKADWLELLKFVDDKAKMSLKKQALADIALQRFQFRTCESRAEVWQAWLNTHHEHRGLLIQFRHSESDWSRGMPEFVDLDRNEPLGFVNIAGRLFCRVK